jgi:hypothetical protein
VDKLSLRGHYDRYNGNASRKQKQNVTKVTSSVRNQNHGGPKLLFGYKSFKGVAGAMALDPGRDLDQHTACDIPRPRKIVRLQYMHGASCSCACFWFLRLRLFRTLELSLLDCSQRTHREQGALPDRWRHGGSWRMLRMQRGVLFGDFTSLMSCKALLDLD